MGECWLKGWGIDELEIFPARFADSLGVLDGLDVRLMVLEIIENCGFSETLF